MLSSGPVILYGPDLVLKAMETLPESLRLKNS